MCTFDDKEVAEHLLLRHLDALLCIKSSLWILGKKWV